MRNHPMDGIERENIAITDIDVIPLSYVDPGGDLWRCGNYQVWKTDGAITRVFTDQGIVGIGEGSPYEGPEYIREYTERNIKPLLLGKNPFDVEFLCNRGNSDRHSRAPWAGVDCACWDIIGKARGSRSGRCWQPATRGPSTRSGSTPAAASSTSGTRAASSP